MKEETSVQILHTLKVNKQKSSLVGLVVMILRFHCCGPGSVPGGECSAAKTSKQTKKIISKCEQLYGNKFEIQIF